MREYSSVTVSTYEAESLIEQLNGKAAEGWDVVSIINAGSSLIAYFSRQAGTGSSAPATAVETAAIETKVSETDTPSASGGWQGTPESPASEEPPVSEPATASAFTAFSTSSDDADSTPFGEDTASTPDNVGWGASNPAETAASEQSTAQQTVGIGQSMTTEQTTTAAASGTATNAGAAAAPAGWYADPANRYELRYWDGSQWTEHVSRAGQQYTDPPHA